MKKEDIQFKDNMPFTIKVLSVKKYPIHWHENVTEMLLPIKGSIEVKANFERILVKEGDFFFINNRTIHSIESPSRAIVISLYLDLNYFEKDFNYIKYMFFRNNMYYPGGILSESDNLEDEIKKEYNARFRNLIINVIIDAMSKNPATAELLKDSIYQVTSFMVNEFNWIQFLKNDNGNISKMQLDRYHRIIKYIHEHYQEKITLEDIAKEVYITKNYLSHFWKDISNFSLMEMINFERVLESEFLLLTTNMSVLDIADYCGFSHVKYYYKHFKRWYGCNPLDHKNMCLSYSKGPFDYYILKLSNVEDIIDEYLKNIIIPKYGQKEIWKTTSLFNNFVKLKYLYKLDKINPNKSPRNIVIDIFSPNNFKIINNTPFFNWQNIDLIVNFSETYHFQIDLKFNCKYLEREWVQDTVHKFIELCIYRYRMITIKKWTFFINYDDENTFNIANAIGNIITRMIPDANIQYFFEV